MDSCLRRNDKGKESGSLRLIEMVTLLPFLPEREEDDPSAISYEILSSSVGGETLRVAQGAMTGYKKASRFR